MASHGVEILVVEDEESLRLGTCDLLAFHGYLPTGTGSGEEGLALALTGRFALVLLDVMLPDVDGFTACRRLREAIPGQPILLLTALGTDDDVVTGFRCGADDYVTKPFSLRELLARVEALLRRAGRLPKEEQPKFRAGGWEVDPATRRGAHAERGDVELSERELALLASLHRAEGRVVSRRSLLQEAWGWGRVDGVQTRTVDVHVASLRKKLGDEDHSLVETVRGEGYRLRGAEAVPEEGR